METQAEFAERWIAEYRVRTARTADWLLSHPELPPRKYQETVQQRQANITKKEITLTQTYEINWNHPRMREALRLYFYNNLRFEDKVNLNQNEAPDDIDINPDFWNDVSQILKQLKYRDLSMNFGMANYCPLFSSKDIDKVPTYYHSNQSTFGPIDQSPTFSTKDLPDKDPRQICLPAIDGVTSPNAFDDLRACGSVVRNPGLVYQHFAVQCGKGADGNLVSATDFNRVASRRAKDSQDEFNHGCTGGLHMTQCSASNNGTAIFHKVTDSRAAYYHELARGMHHKQFNNTPTETVASSDVTDSQAAFYHEYARRISHAQSTYADLDTVISPNLTESRAEFYHKFERGIYRDHFKASGIDRVTSPGVQDSQAAYYHEYAKGMFQKPPMKTFCREEGHGLSKKNDTKQNKSGHYQESRHNGSEAKRSCLIRQNPLLHQLARDSKRVGFDTPSVLVYIQTSQEIAWKKFPFKTDFVMVNGRMIRDFSFKEIKREYNGYTDREGSLESLDVGLHVRGNLGSNVTEYNCQSHASAGVKFTTIAADREKLLKQNDESIPNINDTKKSAGSLCSEDSLEKAIREILSEDDLLNQCTRHIRKDEMNLEDISPKVLGKNGKDRDSKRKGPHKYTKEDNVDIAGGDPQTKSQQQHLDSIREKANATSQAQRKHVVNPQLPDNDVNEQTRTVITNTQSRSTSLWSAGDFYKSVISREQEQLGCGLNDDLTPPKATQKIYPRTCSVPINRNQVGQTSSRHKTTNNSDERMRDSHLLDPNPDDRELSLCPCAKTSIPELKPRQSNKLLRFIQRKAAHLKSKISSLSCRSSVLHNK